MVNLFKAQSPDKQLPKQSPRVRGALADSESSSECQSGSASAMSQHKNSVGGGKPVGMKPSPAKAATAAAKSMSRVFNRSMAVTVAAVTSNRQPFALADKIDEAHPKMRAILREAGLPYNLMHMHELRDADVAAIMDCMVLSVEAYNHYQQEVMAAAQDMDAQIRELSRQLALQEKQASESTSRADSEAKRAGTLAQEKAKLEAKLGEKIDDDRKKILCLEKAAIDANIREKQQANQIARLNLELKSLAQREAQLSTAIAKGDTKAGSGRPSPMRESITNLNSARAQTSALDAVTPDSLQADTPPVFGAKASPEGFRYASASSSVHHASAATEPLSASQVLFKPSEAKHITPSKHRETFQASAGNKVDGVRDDLTPKKSSAPPPKRPSAWKRFKAKFAKPGVVLPPRALSEGFEV